MPTADTAHPEAAYGEYTRWLGDAYATHQRGLGKDGAVKRNALVLTPGFVSALILDKTLTPAIAEFGLEVVRMIDPCCGPGHFLCHAFDRLWPLWCTHAPGMPPIDRAQRVLDAIHGVDIDRMAVAIARFRLGLAASNAAGLRFLEAAPPWKIHVVWGDSLLPADDELQPWNRAAQDWTHGGLGVPP
jgi:hypothetical protein